jgi:hypothetical protein
MYFYIKSAKCPGCLKFQTFKNTLRIKRSPDANYNLLLSCSIECAKKFIKPASIDELITKNRKIPYRKITQSN